MRYNSYFSVLTIVLVALFVAITLTVVLLTTEEDDPQLIDNGGQIPDYNSTTGGGGSNNSTTGGGGSNNSTTGGGGSNNSTTGGGGSNNSTTGGGGSNNSTTVGGGSNNSTTSGGGSNNSTAGGGGSNNSTTGGGGSNSSTTGGGGINNSTTGGGGNITAAKFSKAAVAADTKICSEVGKDILMKNGSAVDVAVATLFCIGLVHMHSSGIGGGGFMNVYIREQRKCIIYDFRETAPGASTARMFVPQNASSRIGGLSVGVPGHVKGLHHVWKKHGKLTWPELINPTISMAENGFVITKALGDKIVRDKFTILNESEGFRELFLRPNGSWYGTGDVIKNVKLAATLRTIRDDPDDFYHGNISQEIVQDVQEAGGIITLADLSNYTVAEREPLVSDINGMRFYTMPPPGSGAVIAMTMNILMGYNLSSADIGTNEKLIQTTHKIIEALKFAFARRPLLGDPSFELNVTRVLEAMLNQSFAETLRQKIRMSEVYPNQTYYGGYYTQDEDPYGTTHLSILAENGDAVAATDTINYGFGSGVRSSRNGIIYNNEMDDFSTPGVPNLWGYLPAEANYIKPGKRPLSSMSPTIVTNADGDVIMVAGASGGSRIITAIAQTLIRKLYLNEELGKAVTESRIHTHLLPYVVYINKVFKIPQVLIDGLEALGHQFVESEYWAAVQTIYKKDKNSTVEAVSDPRKGGIAAGY